VRYLLLHLAVESVTENGRHTSLDPSSDANLPFRCPFLPDKLGKQECLLLNRDRNFVADPAQLSNPYGYRSAASDSFWNADVDLIETYESRSYARE
jgi:hypothetical protein